MTLGHKQVSPSLRVGSTPIVAILPDSRLRIF